MKCWCASTISTSQSVTGEAVPCPTRAWDGVSGSRQNSPASGRQILTGALERGKERHARLEAGDGGRLVATGWNRYVSAFTCGGKILYGIDEAGGSARPAVTDFPPARQCGSLSWRIGAPFVSGSRAVHTRLTSTTIAIMAPSAGTPQLASNGAAMIVGKAPPINPAR